MKFSASLAAAALLATATAAPTVESAVNRRAHRRSGMTRRRTNFHSNPLDPTAVKTGGHNFGPEGNHTYAGPGGWAGGVMANQNGVTQVSASVTVPTPSVPPNGNDNTNYGGSAWVGIDGYGTDTLWQTGISWTITGSDASFSGWYEWYPAGSVQFQGFSVQPGDTISMNIVASSTTSGTASLSNSRTGQSVSQPMSGQPALVQQSAEFIVEDFSVSGGSIPFAAFSPAVTFSGCSYTDSAGSSQGISGAQVLNIGSSSDAFTSCSANGNSVSCSYTGNAANS